MAHLKCLTVILKKDLTHLTQEQESVPVDFASEKDMNMKLQMLCKVCPNPPEASKPFRIPKKAMTLREKQHYKAEMIRRVHEHQ